MRLASVAASLPSRAVTNADILDLVRTESVGFHGDLDQTLREIRFGLGLTGSDTRRWRAEGERPIDLLADAGQRALADAGLAPEDVDVLIYTGIGRGFLEPGGAYHAAAALGVMRAQCFDVLDACMSWTRAVQILRAMFRAGMARAGLVVNAEFNMGEGGPVVPGVFALSSPDAVDSRFPAFTIGEAATATVLLADDTDDTDGRVSADWRFEFASRPDLADLCNVPLEGYEGYCAPSPRIARNGVNRFTSFGALLHSAGRDDALAVLERLEVDPREVDLLVTHASSKKWWADLAQQVGLDAAVHHVYPFTGNLVSASVPTALAHAVGCGRLRRGDTVVGWVGSAGMSFAAFTFTF